MNFVLLFLVSIITLVNCTTDQTPDDSKIVRAVLESCPGCQLNRLPDVRAFVYEDLPKYENVEFKKIQGAPPDLIFYDENDTPVKRFSLRSLTREQCNDLLLSRGFKQKQNDEL